MASARFRTATGDTVRVRRWGGTGAQTERALIKALKDTVATAGDDLSPRTRVRDLADYWLRTEIEPSERGYNTKARDAQTVKSQIKPGLGGLMIREATTAVLDRFLKAAPVKHGDETARGCKTVLSGMFGLAARFDLIPANPVRGDLPDVIAIPDQGPDVREALKGFSIQSGQSPVTPNPLTRHRPPAIGL